MAEQPGFFDADERLRALCAAGDPLERLKAVVDFELLRPELEAAFYRADRSRGGGPPYDAVLMLRILVLQTLDTLSGHQTEYQIGDRLSFMRAWRARCSAGRQDHLAVSRATEHGRCAAAWLRSVRCHAARARLSGHGRADRRCHSDRTRQIDRDGRWTIRRGRKQTPPPGEAQRQVSGEIALPVFGDNNHLGIDRTHGLIRRFTVTHAARHDGSQLAVLLDADNVASGVWADTAYRSKANLRLLDRRRLVAQFQPAKPRRRPMPPHIARGNATRAQVRARVEHVFAAEKHAMGLVIRTIGHMRATAKITLANLAYNMRRLVCMQTVAAPA